jgi:RNA-binding protein Musashi
MMDPMMGSQGMMPQQAAQGQGFDQQGGMAGANRPGYNPLEQMAFEQQKFERQQQQRMQVQQQFAQQANYGQAGPTSWEGMYDDVPQPNVPPQGPQRGGAAGQGFGRGNFNNRGARQQNTPPVQPINAPPNAPTGPKNAGKPGANYRGGGRGGRGGFHPYSR